MSYLRLSYALTLVLISSVETLREPYAYIVFMVLFVFKVLKVSIPELSFLCGL